MLKLPRHAELWLPGYLRSRLRSHMTKHPPRRVWVAIADHYEPYWKTREHDVALERVIDWRNCWPAIAHRHVDDVGRHPQYTFFYPEEEYNPRLLDILSSLKDLQVADVEVHLHHDNDSEPHFIDIVSTFIHTLRTRHNLLRAIEGHVAFGFIHGLWALDNSNPTGQDCGLNNEITLLKRLGCYADFTMPCGALPMQARLVNSLYWVTDDPQRPKSYDTGILLDDDTTPRDLLMIPGPFGLVWKRSWRPKTEIGELAYHNPVDTDRVRVWLNVAPRIKEDIFIKLFAHGTPDPNRIHMLQGGLDRLFQLLRSMTAEQGLELRYVTAYELYQAAMASAKTKAITPSPSSPSPK